MNTYVQQAPVTAPPGWHPDPQAPGGVARRGAGLTQLPTPKVDADVYSSGISGGELSDRPGQIILTDHSLLENISWSSYGGEVSEASATLYEPIHCLPSCADDPGDRVSATVKAWQPSFTPDGVRYYSKLTVVNADGDTRPTDVNVY
jgi:hypothetical protein